MADIREQFGTLYQQYFGRAPDEAGLNFWVDQYNKNPDGILGGQGVGGFSDDLLYAAINSENSPDRDAAIKFLKNNQNYDGGAYNWILPAETTAVPASTSTVAGGSTTNQLPPWLNNFNPDDYFGEILKKWQPPWVSNPEQYFMPQGSNNYTYGATTFDPGSFPSTPNFSAVPNNPWNQKAPGQNNAIPGSNMGGGAQPFNPLQTYYQRYS